MNNDLLLYDIALTFLPGIGNINAKKIVTRFGSSKEIFDIKIKDLEEVPGIGQISAKRIYSSFNSALALAEEELKYIFNNDINIISISDAEYPTRLKECVDAPFLLYYKGKPNFESEKIISIVGTRHPTNYGINFAEKLVSDLAEKYPNIIIISGLALGIDIVAHKSAIKNDVETWAILGHGLSYMYPAKHLKIAQTIYENKGAIICDFPHLTKPDAPNFPQRNRIVAGLSDAVIVVESGIKGGSIITATIANSYNRDVFALPGNINSKCSSGCNNLIKTSRANLIESIEDLEYLMNWTCEKNNTIKPKIINLNDFNDNEKIIIEILMKNNTIEIDELTNISGLNPNTLSLCLLELELNGIIKSMPGKMFAIK